MGKHRAFLVRGISMEAFPVDAEPVARAMDQYPFSNPGCQPLKAKINLGGLLDDGYQVVDLASPFFVGFLIRQSPGRQHKGIE